MESKGKIHKYVSENKESLLEKHKAFFEGIDKIKSYEELSKKIIVNADSIFDAEGKFNKEELLRIIFSNMISSKIDEMFGN